MKFFVVGYMASGKTTFGKELAGDKGLPFLDLDECIEEREGRSISEIFATDGNVIFGKPNGGYCTSFAANEMSS